MAAAPDPIGEVSLAQYAAVRAAVAEGFLLEDVLATEGLKPRAFARADVAWKQRLAGDPEQLAAYETELADAEDWLDRRVELVTEDAAVWASFLAAFEAHAEPFAFLQAKGLGMNDVSRLRRRWARRVERDAKIGERIAELRAKPGKLGPLRLGPLVLRPSRVAQARASVEDRAGGGAKEVAVAELGLGVAEYAALCAELDAVPEQRERVLRRHGLADEEAYAALARRWRAALDADPVLERSFRGLRDHHERRLELMLAGARSFPERDVSTAPVAAAPAAPMLGETRPASCPALTAPATLQTTAPVLELPLGPELPFAPADGEPAIAKPEPKPPRAAESLTGTAPTLDIPRGPELPFPGATKPEVKRPPSTLVETSLQLQIPRGPVLPFAPGPPSATGAAAASPSSAMPKRVSEGLGETSPTVDVPRGPVVPFVEPAASKPAAELAPSGPGVVRAPAALQGTAPVLEVPKGPVLPFAGAIAGARAEGAEGQSEPERARPAGGLGEASMMLEIPRELLKAATTAPGASGAPTLQAAAPSPAPRSPISSVGGPVSVTDPLELVLPLAKYASLCAELAVFPHEAEAIFRRYGLEHVEERAAADAAWKERLRRDPVQYGMWEVMYQRYYRWAKRGAPSG